MCTASKWTGRRENSENRFCRRKVISQIYFLEDIGKNSIPKYMERKTMKTVRTLEMETKMEIIHRRMEESQSKACIRIQTKRK